LFDIVRKEGNKVFCINDTQEELLFRNLDELTRKTASAKGGMKKIDISFSFLFNPPTIGSVAYRTREVLIRPSGRLFSVVQWAISIAF
jgi:hypothetical protein